MRQPTFVIAGGQRCGTTWLYHVLDQHPEVYMAKPVRPEPKFFLRPDGELDREEYLNTWFRPATTEAAVGEKSTSYLESAAAAKRMNAMFPELQVVLILRHPVERAVSHYLFSVKNGFETAPFEEAIRNEAARKPVEGVSVDPYAYLRRGHYVNYIRPYLDELGQDRIKVVITEHASERPDDELPGLFAFLGIDPAFRPAPFDKPPNAVPWNDTRLRRPLLEELLGRYHDSNRELEQLFSCDVAHWDVPSETLLQTLEPAG